MMINETIILLVHYYDPEERHHRVLKNMIKNWCGIYLPFDLYLYKPLQKNFSRAIVYDYLKRRAEMGVRAVNEEIISLVRKEHPKYVLWVSWQYDILPSTLESIRKEGAMVVGWFFDDEWRFDSYSKWWTPYLDYCVTNDIDAVPKYKELGARVVQTIPNTGVVTNVEWASVAEKYGVSFVGTRNAERECRINALRNINIPVHLFGEGWEGYVPFEEMLNVFTTSKINLNFSTTYYKTLGIKGRIFQVCLAGGFLLTEYAPGIGEFFEIDKEIVCFHNTEEMIDKITYYLSHDEERRAIAQAGWKRAVHEYTSFHIVARVFNQIEQDVAAMGGRVASVSPKLKMPLWVRMIPSQYHFQWVRTLMEANCEETLWKDSLTLPLSYNPINIWAWYYYMASFLPSFVRPALFGLYGALEKLLRVLYYKLNSIPYLREMMQQRFVKKAVLYFRL